MELTDMTNGIGYLHVMYPALTTDEILLTRAEAYAMKGKYDKALADLNIWGKAFYESTSDVTVEDINTFYGTPVYDSKVNLFRVWNTILRKLPLPKTTSSRLYCGSGYAREFHPCHSACTPYPTAARRQTLV